MPDSRRRIFVPSTMHKASFLSGHVNELPVPCTVQGIYIPKTGTIILESVLCDDRDYCVLEVSSADLAKFYEELKQAAIASED